MHSEIDAFELLNRLNKGEKLNLLDVREEIEFNTYNIGGQNIPLKSVGLVAGGVIPNKSEEIIVICTAGLRSATAATLLADAGYTNVRNLTGGLLAVQKIKH